jgi:hypothetical protein
MGMDIQFTSLRNSGCIAIFFLVFGAGQALAGSQGASGIVASIDKGPVSRDGNVQGQPTDVVITLDSSLDPNVEGHSLKEGKSIKIFFPYDFDLSDLGGYPLAGVGSAGCVPGSLVCTTGVLLKGWPQNPVPPPNYALSIEDNAIIYTAQQDIDAAGSLAPGIKQIHMILHGVENPKPGHYRIRVEAETGPGSSVETGSVLLHIVPRDRPSINVTSVYAGAMNTIYQTTTVNTMAPLEWSFLVWGKNGAVLDDISIEWADVDEWHVLQNGKLVGHMYVDAPAGASGQDAYLVNSDGLPAAPVIGGTPGIGPQPVGRLQLQFVTGSEVGEYVTTLMLNGGNFAQMHVTATP